MKKILVLLLAAVMCLGLAACGNSTTPTPSSSVEPVSTPESTPSEPAELSGKVTVYMPSPAGLADQIAAGFKAATGVEVEVFQGTTGEILARLEAEQANPVADVVILASWSDGLSMKNDGKIMSYTPANADKVVDGWIDSDSMLFGYSASAVGVIYNTTVIPELSADWSELGGEAYKGQLAIPDPEKSGACKDFVAGYVNANGWTDFEAMAANGMTVPGANKAALEAVTTGEVGILVAGVDYNAYSSIAKGEPLAIYYPAGGTVVNPRPAMILNTAPNVDNAKAFIDYLFSDEAQKMVASEYLLPGRSDVQCEGRTNLADIPQITCEWDKMMAIASESAAKINEICQ
ncbi:MAG: extracellular solute-binding protein [Oscillospiraceae bacterium]|nr:extracellular solute-binding protein [Oscillospiraceae bacterium]